MVYTKTRLPAYQLAVVVDDARQGVTDVVRGDDLLRSTARQVLLYGLLELGPPPAYRHVPLVCGPDGRRLAKRHGDTRVATYRDGFGCPPEKIVGLLARWCGLSETREPMAAATFLDRFATPGSFPTDPDINHQSSIPHAPRNPDGGWAKLPADPITLTPEDDAWLKAN